MPDFNFCPSLPPSSLITVTGANGYIAGHVCDQALAAGYRVRGTVRDLNRTRWLQALFQLKYGAHKFSLVRVEDIFSEGAFDDAVKGASAFVHVATDTNIPIEPEPFVRHVTHSTLSALNSAAMEPTMERFVLTSSTVAAAPWQMDVQYIVKPNSWNEKWLKEAYEGPFDQNNLIKVYAASKVRSRSQTL